MTTLRSLIFFLLFVTNTILFGVAISLVGLFIPFRYRSMVANGWGHSTLWMLKLLCNLDYEVRGQEHLPTGGFIAMAKHQSTWETIALRCILPPNQSWVLKRELMWLPVFGWALALNQPIPIDRNAGRKAIKQIIDQGIERLQAGRTVVIFPEGTRVAAGERKRYGLGGSLLAEKSAYPVVPIAHNAGVFWARRGVKKYPGTIQVIIGEAIDTRDKSAGEINAAVEEWIEGEVAKLPHQPA